jgi:hypothetical protein
MIFSLVLKLPGILYSQLKHNELSDFFNLWGVNAPYLEWKIISTATHCWTILLEHALPRDKH